MHSKISFPIISGSRIRLRPICPDDLTITFEWRNKPETRCWFFNSKILSKEQHYNFFEKYVEKNDDIIYIIELIGEPYVPIGQLSLYNIDWNNHCAEFGRLLIGEDCVKGKGYANEATHLLLDFASSNLGIVCFYAKILVDNLRSINLCEKNGFVIVTQNEKEILMALALDGKQKEHETL
jgi:RimJ/RimL family protein N-acetyltransferase